jgi:ABC-type multidrug transport system ATPase subunit
VAPPSDSALVLEHLTVSDRRVVACEDVSLRVAAGTIYALLDRKGSGTSSIMACVAGERRPSAGHVRLFGDDPRKSRRRTRKLVALISAESRSHPAKLLVEALAREARLLALEDVALHPSSWDRSERNRQLREAVSKGATVLFATSRAADAEGLADRVGILRAGRLVLDEEAGSLAGQFRKIRYQNEMTPTRTEYGTELDRFEAVRVRVRGWGVEAVVSNFSDELFGELRAGDGIIGAEAVAMTLEEIFEAMAPPGQVRT